MSRTAPLLLCLALAPSAGCAFFEGIRINGEPIGNRIGKGKPAVHYSGPECAKVELDTQRKYLDPGERHPDDPPAVAYGQTGTEHIDFLTADQPDPAAPFMEQAAHVVCSHQVGGRSKNTRMASTTVYLARFDDYQFDNEAAAMLLATTRRMRGQLYRTVPEEANQHERWLSGILYWYAEHLDRDAVVASLKEAGAPPEFQRLFLSRLDDAVTTVEAIVKRMPEAERYAFVELPDEVHADTEAYYRKNDALMASFRELQAKAAQQREGGVSDETVAALSKLRVQYVAKHGGAADAVHDGLPALVAHELFVADVTRGDAAAAAAEMELVVPTGPHGRPAAAEIERRQTELFAAAQATRNKSAANRNSGLDAATASALSGGGDAYDYSQANPWHPGEDRRLQYEALLPGRPNKFAGKVKKTTKGKDGTATIVFADHVTRWADEKCWDTNKIERVYADGRIDYRQRCKKTGKVNTDRRSFDPVVVTAGEAKRLRSGDEVYVWTSGGDPKTGAVRWVRRKDKLVVLRDVPVKAAKG